jgi:hypothetical protein
MREIVKWCWEDPEGGYQFGSGEFKDHWPNLYKKLSSLEFLSTPDMRELLDQSDNVIFHLKAGGGKLIGQHILSAQFGRVDRKKGREFDFNRPLFMIWIAKDLSVSVRINKGL